VAEAYPILAKEVNPATASPAHPAWQAPMTFLRYAGQY